MVSFSSPPEYLRLNKRLGNNCVLLHEYTVKEKQETAGFLIRALHGGIGVVNLLLGKSKSVDLEPEERLHEGEAYLGTIHAHPQTDNFSVHDVATFLADPDEKISICIGADGSLNILIKCDETEEISIDGIKQLKEAYEQDEISDISSAYKFLYYKGKGDRVNLVYRGAWGEVSPDPQTVGTRKSAGADLDEYVRDIKGVSSLPHASIKKVLERIKKEVDKMGLLDRRNFNRIYRGEG